MSFSMIIKLFIMACGIYMAYWAVQMKKTNKIPEVLVGKGFPINRAKDPEGFIQYTFPFTLGTGIVLVLAGLLGAMNVFVLYPVIDVLISFMPLVLIIVYSVMLMKAQRKYLIGIQDKK